MGTFGGPAAGLLLAAKAAQAAEDAAQAAFEAAEAAGEFSMDEGSAAGSVGPEGSVKEQSSTLASEGPQEVSRRAQSSGAQASGAQGATGGGGGAGAGSMLGLVGQLRATAESLHEGDINDINDTPIKRSTTGGGAEAASGNQEAAGADAGAGPSGLTPTAPRPSSSHAANYGLASDTVFNLPLLRTMGAANDGTNGANLSLADLVGGGNNNQLGDSHHGPVLGDTLGDLSTIPDDGDGDGDGSTRSRRSGAVGARKSKTRGAPKVRELTNEEWWASKKVEKMVNMPKTKKKVEVPGGRGAVVIADVVLRTGEVLKICLGQQVLLLVLITVDRY